MSVTTARLAGEMWNLCSLDGFVPFTNASRLLRQLKLYLWTTPSRLITSKLLGKTDACTVQYIWTADFNSTGGSQVAETVSFHSAMMPAAGRIHPTMEPSRASCMAAEMQQAYC